MTFTETRIASTLIFTIQGALDNKCSDLFRETVLDRIEEGDHRLLIDFSQTTYIASMGLRALFQPAQALAKVGGKLSLCGLSTEIKDLFCVAGIFDLFPVYATREEALKG